MSLRLLHCHQQSHRNLWSQPPLSLSASHINILNSQTLLCMNFKRPKISLLRWSSNSKRLMKPISASSQPLDLTEDNINQVLADARTELSQIFDTSVGMTGQVKLAELDGPFVKISLKGRFWHKRTTVVARVANYMKQRIPEILEVEIEDEKQLDDSPANF